MRVKIRLNGQTRELSEGDVVESVGFMGGG
jgi:hypothetical protein